MSTIGFLTKTRAVRQKDKDAVHRSHDAQEQRKILIFDSKRGIYFSEANRHIFVGGATGCGKTTNGILPAAESCIAAGFGGFVVDIKNNMTEKIKAIAAHYGREGDVIELGSEDTALPMNILHGMQLHEVYDFLYTLMQDISNPHDHNKHFHMRGLGMTKDLVHLLLHLVTLEPRCAPTVSNISQLINDFPLAAELFNLFAENTQYFASESAPISLIQALIRAVKSNRFHVCNDSYASQRDQSTHGEQTTFALGAIRDALHAFLQTPGFVENFSASNGQGYTTAFSMQKMLQQKKIVVLRFSHATGSMGARMARYLTEQFYQAVYATGLSLPKEQYSFVILDEFQQFADLGDGRFSDANFVAQAREFNCIFMAATQSMSALVTQRHDIHRVWQFVANCNNRIIFYSDDKMLQEMVERYDDNVKLNCLENEVFVIRYDGQRRRHMHGIESLQNAHDHMQDVLTGVKERKIYNMKPTVELEPVAAYADWVKKALENKEAQEAKTRAKPRRRRAKNIECPF